MSFKTKLRRLTRFSLRFFLIAVTLFSAWIGLHVRSAHRQREAVNAFTDYGGWFRYDFECDEKGYFDPKLQSRVPSFLLDKLGHDFFHSVKVINLVGNHPYHLSYE